ncbi:sulfatase family protein [Tunicatimonas pelagia]|uniref:sulfatase family protein n=1 Tax=Tunicatimonas pelagia TaxID=931531 RepID=UPI0026657067|nr:sulfatase [Tunicatimonas pelagia]WKN46149.1 sulfatase [Tunicatimonas pelagia]
MATFTHKLFFGFLLVALGILTLGVRNSPKPEEPLNILILHTDQWRAQAFGYRGDPNVKTPHIDQLAAESANLFNAVSGMPVCTPHRASLLTGQHPLTHGLFMNDVQLDTTAITIAEVLADAGYQTGYIGKWHLDGRGRHSFTPPGGRRQGFQYWKALECSHNYNNSAYYTANSPEKKFWEGYDAIAQAEDAQQYIRDHAQDEQPFFLFVSWGTPHAPYRTAPQEYLNMYAPKEMQLHPNVPPEMDSMVRADLAGYYAHCTALDDQIANILQTLEDTGTSDNTIILFTSDHGDLLGSHRAYKKQQPYEESIRVPMLIRHPQILPGEYAALMNSYDIMPTLLGLSDAQIPSSVEGYDFSEYLIEQLPLPDTTTLISCVQPFGQWNRFDRGGKEYRGIVTLRYTYTRDLNGSWLFFDNQRDPYQMNNLINNPAYSELQQELDKLLTKKLKKQGDEFRPGMEYIREWGYPVDAKETVPYTP